MLAGRISCSETAAAENGIVQITFDEYHCISPDYLENFKSGISLRVEDKEQKQWSFLCEGDIDWYGLQSKKFLKKLPDINRIGCPDGYKNMDEDICIDEYWLDQFKKGLLTLWLIPSVWSFTGTLFRNLKSWQLILVYKVVWPNG